MKTSLDHLPHAKQRELERVLEILFEEFDATLATANAAWKKRARIYKIILFGSFARVDWVDDRIGELHGVVEWVCRERLGEIGERSS